MTTAYDIRPPATADGLELLWEQALGCAVLRPRRGPDDDLDLLVAPEDLGRVLTLLRSAGFVEVPAFGRGTHRFLVRLEGRTFVELDLVTSLDFGPLGCWPSGMAATCLERSVVEPGATPRLDPRDELWVTLLHLLADDGKDPRRSHRLERLGELAAAAAVAPLEDWHRAAAPLLPPTTSPAELVELCARSDTAALGEALAELRDGVRRRCGRAALVPRHLSGTARTALLRATEKPRQWRGRRGLLVTVLGPDGAGKSTLVETLGEAWPWPHQRIYFGLWPDAHDSSAVSRVLWPLRRPLRAMGRYGAGVVASSRGRLVVFDRYVYDAAVPPRAGHLVLKRIYFAVLLRCVPAPDVAVLLEAPGDVLFARKGEMSPEVLDENRDAIAAHVLGVERRAGRPRVVRVDATRSAAEVADEVVAALWQVAAARLVPRSSGRSSW
jgi:thymidylate kinase